MKQAIGVILLIVSDHLTVDKSSHTTEWAAPVLRRFGGPWTDGKIDTFPLALCSIHRNNRYRMRAPIYFQVSK